MSWMEKVEDGLRVFAVILGIAFAAVGMILVFIGNEISNSVFRYSAFVLPEEFVNSCRATVILGVSLFILISLQIVGSVRKWSFFLILNVALLVYLCIIGFILIQYSTWDSDKLQPELRKGLWISLKRFGEESEIATDFRRGWTFIQLNLKCCGVNNYTEWKGVKKRSRYDPQVPTSCCKTQMAFCSDAVKFVNHTQDAQFIFTEGCYEKAKADIPFYHIRQGLIPFEVIGILSTANSAFLIWRWTS